MPRFITNSCHPICKSSFVKRLTSECSIARFSGKRNGNGLSVGTAFAHSWPWEALQRVGQMGADLAAWTRSLINFENCLSTLCLRCHGDRLFRVERRQLSCSQYEIQALFLTGYLGPRNSAYKGLFPSTLKAGPVGRDAQGYPPENMRFLAL